MGDEAVTPPADIHYLYPSTLQPSQPPPLPEPIKDRLMLRAENVIFFLIGVTVAFLISIWSSPQPLDMLRGQIRAGKASADDLCRQLQATAPTPQRTRPPALPRRP